MACSSREKYGYEDELFEKDVDDEFHCPICHNVLKDPRMCQHNEHIFCHDCITEHLRVNSATCPQCKDSLTVKTLCPPPRLLMNYLSKLRIKCDYFDRGCQEFICLENLRYHIDNCDFAPAKCSNKRCQKVINKREKIHHESSDFKYRKENCHSCRQIEVKVEEIKHSLVQTNEIVDKKVETVKAHVDVKLKALKDDVQKVKKSIAEVNSNMAKVTNVMGEVLGKLRNLERSNQGASSVGKTSNAILKDIFVAGGCGAGCSVEKFSWKKNLWVEMTSMNTDHLEASSFVYRDQVFIVGGAGRDARGTVEVMNARDEILNWEKFLGSLPYPCCGHQTVVYRHRVILIGGMKIEFEFSSQTASIFEIGLTPPYSRKLLGEMPEPRMGHGAEIFDNKVLILGGRRYWWRYWFFGFCIDTLHSVLEFDLNTRKCKVMPSLPRAVSEMATVCWRDKVVVMGGQNKNREALNDVLMYDCKTGRTDVLPSMLKRRVGCRASITGDTIVVIGGHDEHWEGLSSAEYFKLGDQAWKYLPAMNKARTWPIAEVLL